MLNRLESLRDVEGKIVVVRAGLNVSLREDGSVEDSFRIDRVLPTLTYLQKQGARILVIAHIGRETEENLTPVYHYLQERLDKFGFDPQTFYELETDDLDVFEKRFTDLVSGVPNGEIVLLDNIRQTALEKANSAELAAIIANSANYYVNEAFPVAHREHMSVYALPLAFSKESRFIGKNFESEIDYMEQAQNPEKPALFAISGNKVRTKMPLIEKFVDKYEYILPGGVIANTIYKLLGYQTGNSIVDDEIDEDLQFRLKDLINKKKILVPEYVVVEKPDGDTRECFATEVMSDEIIYDISPKSFDKIGYANVTSVLWNGPLGHYEKGYSDGTNALARHIAESGSTSVVGGGNTVSAIRALGYEDKFTFLSTAGGAMLDYLADGDLPAINALLTE